MNLSNYLKDHDLLWIASDAVGQLAAFLTGGAGPIPKSVLAEHVDICSVEDDISLLPVVTSPRLLISVPRPDDFVALAQRGLWVYDWQDVHRSSSSATQRYELVAMPVSPASVGDLPVRFGKIAALARFKDISFEDHASLDVSSLAECVSAQDGEK